MSSPMWDAEKVVNLKADHEMEGETSDMQESGMAEDRRKWRFLCKMYGILTAQWMLTFIISTIITFFSPIPNLLIGKLKITASVVIVTVCLSLILLRLLYSYGKQVGLNLILLGLLSLSVSIGVGASCGNISDKAGTFVRDLLVLISVSFSSIFGYTLGAIKNNLEFNLARPWRLSCFHISVLVSFEQIFVPYAFAAGFCVIIFSFMIYSAVERLLEKCDYDDYVWASVSIPFYIFKCWYHVYDRE